MDDTAEFGIFHYGRAVEAECPSCGGVQIPSAGFTNISCPTCNGALAVNNNSHHSQVIRSSDHREGNLLPQGGTEEMNHETQAGFRIPDPPCSPAEDPSIQSLTASLVQVSTANNASGVPLQESFGESLTFGCPPSLERVQTSSGKLSKIPTEGHNKDGDVDICHTCGKLNSDHDCLQCYLAVFKRGIISRKEPSFSIYFIPCEKFELVFAKISQTEAAGHEGTEIAVNVVVEEKETQSFFVSHHHQLAIKDVLSVSFEMDRGERFSIISPAGSPTFDVQHILARSEERLFPGACIKLAIEYNGQENTLNEDRVKMTLLTGKAKLLIIIPTKSHTPLIQPLQQGYSVTTMPILDREALRACHVDLIENIGNLSSICAYLYQYNILNANDKAFLKSFHHPDDAIDQLLTMIPKKGNILNIFIYILQQSRENQEAAKILVQKRLQLYGNCRQKITKQ